MAAGTPEAAGALVAVVMGSSSDLAVMADAVAVISSVDPVMGEVDR